MVTEFLVSKWNAPCCMGLVSFIIFSFVLYYLGPFWGGSLNLCRDLMAMDQQILTKEKSQIARNNHINEGWGSKLKHRKKRRTKEKREEKESFAKGRYG